MHRATPTRGPSNRGCHRPVPVGGETPCDHRRCRISHRLLCRGPSGDTTRRGSGTAVAEPCRKVAPSGLPMRDFVNAWTLTPFTDPVYFKDFPRWGFDTSPPALLAFLRKKLPFPALRSVPLALSSASRSKQTPSSFPAQPPFPQTSGPSRPGSHPASMLQRHCLSIRPHDP